MRFVVMMGSVALILMLSWQSALAQNTQGDTDFQVSGQPSAAQLSEFAKQGGQAVVNLRGADEPLPFNEAALANELGVSYYAIPIANANDLTLSKVKLFDQVIGKLQPEQTLLHCASGNRVGAMMALRAGWLQHKSADEALQIGRQHGLKSLADTVAELLQEYPHGR
ncbi:fused DSP-PTPase phosphatase/NAD kinase-like protein [Idiomarina xiamenensis]|uniref:Serine/threonine protein phosphatase n=1 Tax=Idiomarina xiamenensis 10-D-4 TaxID=740709 RepID=K2JWF0_9GAMM|nr:sulfur transferase domain-containing protein [Idiomarina xiamenensis]EKE87661.1 serine/threonine protein phosphatase [Idiomarina xiamenensis 10-D-4]